MIDFVMGGVVRAHPLRPVKDSFEDAFPGARPAAGGSDQRDVHTTRERQAPIQAQRMPGPAERPQSALVERPARSRRLPDFNDHRMAVKA